MSTGLAICNRCGQQYALGGSIHLCAASSVPLGTRWRSAVSDPPVGERTVWLLYDFHRVAMARWRDDKWHLAEPLNETRYPVGPLAWCECKPPLAPEVTFVPAEARWE